MDLMASTEFIILTLKTEVSVSTLRFSDGVNIDTSGPLRILQLIDGWYVVGEGTCMPAKDEEEAKKQLEWLERDEA